MTVICSYCNKPAELVTGKEIYPHRPDLYPKKFWRCRPCTAYVGCHKPNAGYGDGTRPLGRLANAELRAAKSAAHAAFDPVWQEGIVRRGSAYAWLADKLGIPPKECHIGEFDVEQCKRVVQIIKENRHELETRSTSRR